MAAISVQTERRALSHVEFEGLKDLLSDLDEEESTGEEQEDDTIEDPARRV